MTDKRTAAPTPAAPAPAAPAAPAHPYAIGTLVIQCRRRHPRITGTITDSQPTFREGEAHYRYTVAIEREEYQSFFGYDTGRVEHLHMYSDEIDAIYAAAGAIAAANAAA